MIAVPIFGAGLLIGGGLLLLFFAKDQAQQSFAKLLMLCGAIFLVLPFFMGCSLKSQQIAFGGLQGADVVSTVHAESRGAVEANPVMQTNLPERIALKSVSTAGVLYISHELAKRGHAKLSRGLLYALNAVMVGVVVNNWRVAQ